MNEGELWFDYGLIKIESIALVIQVSVISPASDLFSVPKMAT